MDKLSGDVSPIGFNSEKLTLTSPYVAFSHTASLGQGWTATPSAGVRSYSHNVLGDATAPHLGVVLHSAEQLALRANMSKGVSYPGLDAAVLSQLMPLGSSWKSLGAEKMDHKELGLTWLARSGTTLDVSVFTDHVAERYVFAFPPAVSAPSFINLGTYDVSGSEISVQHQVGAGWSLFAGLTNLHSSKSDLPYAPSTSVSLGANWQSGPWRVSMDGQNQSSMVVLGQARANGAANTTQVDGFTVANVRAAYKLPAMGKRGEIFVAAENLLDRQYRASRASRSSSPSTPPTARTRSSISPACWCASATSATTTTPSCPAAPRAPATARARRCMPTASCCPTTWATASAA